MGAPKGNQFWKLTPPDMMGRPKIFESPEILWEKAVEYFQHCESNPFTIEESTSSDKGVYDKSTDKIIPYTWEGLYVFIGAVNLSHYKKNKDFTTIIAHIGNIIRNQKYSGAAAGIFNANIIARDLGLTDKQEIKSENSGAIQIIKLPDNKRHTDVPVKED